MNFEQALAAMKEGKKVRRREWTENKYLEMPEDGIFLATNNPTVVSAYSLDTHINDIIGHDWDIIDDNNEVPNTLQWMTGENYWSVNAIGEIGACHCAEFTNYNKCDYNINHRMFKSEKYAKMFAEKTQFIADLLYFKWLYERDYEPDWNKIIEGKWYVYFDNLENRYSIDFVSRTEHIESIYFKSDEIAKKCADWLNKKYRKSIE